MPTGQSDVRHDQQGCRRAWEAFGPFRLHVANDLTLGKGLFEISSLLFLVPNGQIKLIYICVSYNLSYNIVNLLFTSL